MTITPTAPRTFSISHFLSQALSSGQTMSYPKFNTLHSTNMGSYLQIAPVAQDGHDIGAEISTNHHFFTHSGGSTLIRGVHNAIEGNIQLLRYHRLVMARFGSINADQSREPNNLCLQNYYVSISLHPARHSSCLLQATVLSPSIVEAISVLQEPTFPEAHHCFLGVRRPHWPLHIVNPSVNARDVD
jgi:hypothetical protein